MVMFAGVNARLPGSIVTVADDGASRGTATMLWSGMPAATGVGLIDPGTMTDAQSTATYASRQPPDGMRRIVPCPCRRVYGNHELAHHFVRTADARLMTVPVSVGRIHISGGAHGT